ncbi:MAG: hypothetical protein ACK5OX_18000 [Desertimonas sp.]
MIDFAGSGPLGDLIYTDIETSGHDHARDDDDFVSVKRPRCRRNRC